MSKASPADGASKDRRRLDDPPPAMITANALTAHTQAVRLTKQGGVRSNAIVGAF